MIDRKAIEQTAFILSDVASHLDMLYQKHGYGPTQRAFDTDNLRARSGDILAKLKEPTDAQ